MGSLDGIEEGRVVRARGVDALAQGGLHRSIEGDQLDLAAADIDAVAVAACVVSGHGGSQAGAWMVTPCTTRLTVPSGNGLSGVKPSAAERRRA